MLLDVLHSRGLHCNGCGGCNNVCPAHAILMTTDEEGFAKPKIDEALCISCGLCERICPQLNPKKDRSVSPDCYAVRADTGTIAKSSSGGAFSVLADYAFKRGGVVCGAAFDENFHGVSLVMLESPEDIKKLHGSKYVYAKPGKIYQQVKEQLVAGRLVLFSGTPCQAAALRNVLGKDYDNLLIVDILCGGTPSEAVYSKYIEEISEGREVSSVEFRPKEFGWSYSGIRTKFKDGSQHMIHSVKDPYLRGFLNWLYVGEACASCQFAAPPRQGDFSIGDFWNIDRYDETLKHDDGVSCLLVNSDKAKAVFVEVSESFELVRKIPLSFLKRFNRLQEKRNHHLARPRFFSLLKEGFSFEKAVDYSLFWKFDVALSGCFTVPNYGGELTYYALYKILNDMGYSTIMVERRADIPNYDVPKPRLFRKSPYPFYDVSRIHKNFRDQAELNRRVRRFVLGSDQIWNIPLWGNGNEDPILSYSFDYVSDYRKKISYATSFGTSSCAGTEEQKKKLGRVLERFHHISVRESSGTDILKNEFGLDGTAVLDPVLCCDAKHFAALMANATVRTNGKYMATYMIWPNRKFFGLEKMAEKLGYGYVNILGVGKETPAEWPYTYEANCKLEDWLYYIANSDFICADSFHGICLAIVFRKDFAFIKGDLEEGDGKGRVSSLLNCLGIKGHIYKDVSEALDAPEVFEPLDYGEVYTRLEAEKSRSMNWLKEALASDLMEG